MCSERVARLTLVAASAFVLGCGAELGSDYAPSFFELDGTVSAPTSAPSRAEVAALWVRPDGSGKSAQTLSLRATSLAGFRVDVADFPPEAAMAPLGDGGATRYAAARLLFFDDRDANDRASLAPAGTSPPFVDTVLAVPDDLSLVFLEGPPAGTPDGNPAPLSPELHRGYNLVRARYAPDPACSGAACCGLRYVGVPHTDPIAITLGDDPSLAGYLCDDARGAPAIGPTTCGSEVLPCAGCGAPPHAADGERLTCSVDRRAYLLTRCPFVSCGGADECDARAILLAPDATVPVDWPCP